MKGRPLFFLHHAFIPCLRPEVFVAAVILLEKARLPGIDWAVVVSRTAAVAAARDKVAPLRQVEEEDLRYPAVVPNPFLLFPATLLLLAVRLVENDE